MNTSIVTLALMTVLVSMTSGAPGHFLLSAYPAAPPTHTHVARDFLGNQATSYSYQDGHSSAVSVSRNDVSKHLVAAPVAVAQPVAYAAYAHPAPVYQQAVAGPAYYNYNYNHHPYAAAPAYYL